MAVAQAGSYSNEITEAGPWNLEKVLGSGGFGTVTLWKNQDTQQLLAVKKCRWGTDSLLTEKHKERWAKEVEIMMRLNHLNVVKAYDVPPELDVLRKELPLLCMEYCTRGDLRQVLNRPENCCGIKEKDFRAFISNIASAVQYLHTLKIIHRDLKPENIVLQEFEGRVVYKLIDLGYAKELDQSSVMTSFVGTLQYLAPELFLSKRYTCTVDYWSFGLVAHECITGVRPFLPNMSPAQWMSQVEKKTEKDICAYETEDGRIAFSSELFNETHVSRYLKQKMEVWLQTVLEWDPRTRGRSSFSNNIQVFSLLEGILERQVLYVFCLENCKKLCYPIDATVPMERLQQWIMNDTSIPVSEQELFLPKGNSPDITLPATQCLSEEGDAILYVVRRTVLPSVLTIAPDVPTLVESMLRDPRHRQEYVHQRRTWAASVFLLQQEREIYRELLQGARVYMLNLLVKNTHTNKLRQRLEISSCETTSCHRFLSDSLRVDVEYVGQLMCHGDTGPPSLHKDWTHKFAIVTKNHSELQEYSQTLVKECKTLNSEIVQLQRSPFARIRNSESLDDIYERGLKTYEELRRRPKEMRTERHSSEPMVKIVYHFLKERDRLWKDYFAHFTKLVDCRQRYFQLVEPLEKAIQNFEKLGDDLKLVQEQRQNDVWHLVGTSGKILPQPQPQPHMSMSSSMPSIAFGGHPRTMSRSTMSTNLQSSRMMLSQVLDHSMEESQIIMDENKALRFQLLDTLTRGMQQEKYTKAKSYNWNFLNGPKHSKQADV